jgi:hypothetical protein
MILLALVVQFSLASEGVRDQTGGERASVEVRTRKASYFVEEPITVEIRFAFEPGFLEERLVALFRPPLDLAVQLQAPWLAELPDARWRALPPETSALEHARTFVLDDAVALAREAADLRVDGRRFRKFVLERTLFAQVPGTLLLPEARLRFAYATRWSEGFATERVGLDRIDAFVESAPRSLEILPLPEEGRPADFSGAVGQIELRAEASAPEIALGDSLKLRLRLGGEANLESFDTPRIARIEGWRIAGIIDQRSSAERTFELDLVPLDARVTRIPPIAFSYFDTTPPAEYRTLHTEAIPIAIRGSPARATDAPEERPRAGRDPWTIAAAASAALVVVLAAFWLRARRARSTVRQ